MIQVVLFVFVAVFVFFLGSGRLGYSVPLFFAILFSSVVMSDAACVSGNFSRDVLSYMSPLPSLPSNCGWEGYRIYCREGTGCNATACHCVRANEMAQSACPDVIRISTTMYYTNKTLRSVNPPYDPESSGCTVGSISPICYYSVMCDTKCEADSIACLNDTSKVWNGAACECQPKGQQADPQKCRFCRNKQKGDGVIGETPITWKTYAQIYECVQCHEENGRIVSAEGCEYKYQLEGSCEDNDECPEGEICPDSLRNPVACIATVGATVWMRDQRTGNTFKCEADGSCERAKQMVMNGECKNPYEQPPSSSPSAESSSGAEPSSSDSQPQSSDSEFCDMCDKLGRIVANTQSIMNSNLEIAEYTQQTMDNTTDIKNELSNVSIDVSHIRTNTETTAGNTGTIASNTGAIAGSTNSIDDKLTTTNSLLNDIKNKNWQPHIEVNPEITVQGDTNLITVQGDTNIINVDTAKSGAAILDFLKSMFGDTSNNYNANDTAGMGEETSSILGRLDSAVNQSVPAMGDSIPQAVVSVKGALRGLKDSLNHGGIADSMARWEDKLVNNGVLTGAGSNNCPSVFRRNFQWTFGRIGTVQLGNLGTFLCADPIGIGITLWALARMVLRCMVAITCMLWIYRTVIGVNEADNED